jgi:hypothetical protein
MMRLGAVNRAVWMHKKGGGNQTVQESHTSQKLYLLGASEVTHNYCAFVSSQASVFSGTLEKEVKSLNWFCTLFSQKCKY